MNKFIWLLAFALASPFSAFALDGEEMEKPFPRYKITFHGSKTLPSRSWELAERSVRLLPSYFTNQPTAEELAFPIDGLIELKHMDEKPYCMSKSRICWPKYFKISKGVMMLQSWTGHSAYYKDVEGLHRLLWQELGDNSQID